MLTLHVYTLIGRNVIRALSIISLLLVFASSVVIMVDDIKAVNKFIESGSSPSTNSTSTDIDYDYIAGSTVPNQPAGAFWAVLNRLFIIFQVIVLIFSEIGWPQSFFVTYFPVLGRDFGTGALGVIQCLVGAAVLSHYVTTFAFVSGFFVFVLGCINMLVGLVFRAGAKTAWKDHAKSVLPTHVGPVDTRPMMTSPQPTFLSRMLTRSSSGEKKAALHEEAVESEKTGFGFGFGRQAEKAAALKGFVISRPLESLPRYAAGSH